MNQCSTRVVCLKRAVKFRPFHRRRFSSFTTLPPPPRLSRSSLSRSLCFLGKARTRRRGRSRAALDRVTDRRKQPAAPPRPRAKAHTPSPPQSTLLSILCSSASPPRSNFKRLRPAPGSCTAAAGLRPRLLDRRAPDATTGVLVL